MTVLEQRGRHRWRRELGEALAVVSGGAESILEVRYVRDVERAHGLPVGVAQVSSAAGMPWRHDIGYPQFRVLVELDGRLGHEGQSRVADTRRDRGNAAAGWLTLRAGFPPPCGRVAVIDPGERQCWGELAAGSTSSTRTPPASLGWMKLTRLSLVPRLGMS